MHTHFIEYAIVSVLGLLGAVLAICIAHGKILLPIMAAIAVAVLVYDFFYVNVGDRRLSRKAGNAMQAQKVQITLRYDGAELKQIIRYAKAHDVQRHGRYDFRTPPHLNIWTHAWCNTACREESCVMFRLEFDSKSSALMSVVLMPGFDVEAFVDELAMLEKAAVGRSVHGACRRKHTT